MNSNQSELEWFFYQLWAKTSQSPSKFIFEIPDTIVFKYGKPDTWYFTSKDQFILKKNKINVSNKQIFKSFSKRASEGDLPVATAYFEEEAEGQACLQLRHLNLAELKELLAAPRSAEKPTILQKFVEPKMTKNTVVKCHWSPTLSIVEKSTNVHQFLDTKVSLEERVSTFEGPSHFCTQENVVSNTLLEDIATSIRQIQAHFAQNSSLKLHAGQFFFKVDRQDGLALVFTTNVKTDKVPFEPSLPVQQQQQQRETVLKLFLNRTPSTGEQGQDQGQQQKVRLGQECPFCEKGLQPGNCFEFTYSQILKMFAFYEENKEALLELADSPKKHNFNKRIYMQSGDIPYVFLKLLPGVDSQKFRLKRENPLFLYKTMRLCEVCYLYVKALVEHLNRIEEEGTRSQKLEFIQKMRVIAHNPRYQESDKNAGYSEMGDSGRVPFINRDMENILQIEDPKILEKFPIESQYTVSHLPRLPTSSHKQELMSAPDNNNTHSEKLNPPHQKGQFTFSKVEAGKEVSRYICNNNNNNGCDQVSNSSSLDFYEGRKVEKKHSLGKLQSLRNPLPPPQFNFVKVQNPPPQVKSAEKRKRQNWKQQYRQEMLSKSKQAKGQILQTLEKMGGKQGETMGEELDLRSLGIYSNNGQIVFQSEMSNPVARKGRMKIESIQPASSGLMLPERQDSLQERKRSTVPLERNSTMTNSQRSSNVWSSQNRNPKERMFNQYQIYGSQNGNWQMLSQIKEANKKEPMGPQPKKITRPWSSKPPIKKNKDTLEIRPALQCKNSGMQRQSTIKEQNRMKQVEKQFIESSKPSGFPDFANMSEEDIQQIALKADSLIQIIQNIKTQNNYQGLHRRIEEDQLEEDNTLADITDIKIKQQDNAILDYSLQPASQENKPPGGSWWG